MKFRDGLDLPYDETVADFLDAEQVGPWKALAQAHPNIRIFPGISAVRPERLRALVADAVSRDRTYQPPDFFSCFVVDCPAGSDAGALAAELAQWWSIDEAYVTPLATPAVDYSDDPLVGTQGYLDSAPVGVGAKCAWLELGGDGAGQNLVDLEEAWLLDHDDLASHNSAVLFGVNTPAFGHHGTAVLGIACAADNSTGCVGVAPNVASIGVVSVANGGWPPDAILAAINQLPFGGVLLIEMQLHPSGTTAVNVPYEMVTIFFNAIRLATALGVTVIEAAGNGGNNLDTLAELGGTNRIFDRNDPSFRDSGAVMVGSATSSTPHSRLAASNFGNRIDCYAWGENMASPWANGTAAPNIYTTSFGGTSGAAAVIAGVALSIQGMAQANLGYRFGPWQMRALLADIANGTSSANPAADKIGVMPDLCKIIQNEALALAPDIYMRDFVGDVGNPHSGPISASPDVILLQALEPTPQATFGPGPNANLLLGGVAESGQDNYVHVRVLNRGGSPATSVSATVYWSPCATLVTPSLWTLVGTTTLPIVPPGNVLTVSDAIVWQAAGVPPTGHYCFVALIGNSADPAPIPTSFADGDQFFQLIRENNNVTWHNFNVEDGRSNGLGAGEFALEFLAPGMDDRALWMGLEVVAKLPPGARASLEMPVTLYEAMRHRIEARIDTRRRIAAVPVSPRGLRSIGDFLFPAKSRSNLRLLVHIPKEHRDAYEVYVRQIHDGQEVGRVTWRLGPKAQRQADRPTR